MSSVIDALRAYDVRFADPDLPGGVLAGEFVFQSALEQNTAATEHSLISATGGIADPGVWGELLGDIDGTTGSQKLIGVFDAIEIYAEMAAQTEAVIGEAFRSSYLRYKRGSQDRFYWVGRHLQLLVGSADTTASTKTVTKLNHDIDVEMPRPIVVDMSGPDTLALGTSQGLGAATADIVCSVILHGVIGQEAVMQDFLASWTRQKPIQPLSGVGDREQFRGLRSRRRKFLPGRR